MGHYMTESEMAKDLTERNQLRERIDILEGLCRELWGALENAEPSLSLLATEQTRRKARLAARGLPVADNHIKAHATATAALANAEQINRILEEVDQQERDDNGQFGAGA